MLYQIYQKFPIKNVNGASFQLTQWCFLDLLQQIALVLAKLRLDHDNSAYVVVLAFDAFLGSAKSTH